MKLIDDARAKVANVIAPKSRNSMGQAGTALGQQFLRYGNSKPMMQDWSSLLVTDEEMYTSYLYGAIRKRANRVAQVATTSIRTDAAAKIMAAAKTANLDVVHPYLALIKSSPTFTSYTFWHDISTYLDIEGVYYLFALRNKVGDRVGNITEFKLLNPYEITRLLSPDGLTVIGYQQNHKGMVRDIPPEMIIEMRELNPFRPEEPYSMTDAAKEHQFTLKQAGDYTRHSLKSNMSAPGVLSTDVILEDEQFKQFISRVRSAEKGEPLYGNGPGAISYTSMQIDMDKAALQVTATINVEPLLAVAGVSKTTMGIEVSGVTRDTSDIQSDLFVTSEILPRLQLMSDALSLDYQNNYPTQFTVNQYEIVLDSPLDSDREAELSDITIRNNSYNLYVTLVNEGYDRELAAKYAAGEINLEDLGEPTNEPKSKLATSPDTASDTLAGANGDDTPPSTPDPEPPTPPATQALSVALHDHQEAHQHPQLTKAVNELITADRATLNTQEASLQNTIVGIQAQVAAAVINKVTRNAFDTQADVIDDDQRQKLEHELEVAIALFYGVIVSLYAKTTMAKRTAQYGLQATFKLDAAVKDYINQVSEKAAASHMDTIVEDLRAAAQSAEYSAADLSKLMEDVQAKYPDAIEDDVSAIIKKAALSGKDSSAVAAALHDQYSDTSFEGLLKQVRSLSLTGASQQQLVNGITNEYSDISKARATLIATTETNRAFTTAQYEADTQFLNQNGLMDQAYKQLQTTSENPCPFCSDMASQPPIPFSQNFADLGDVLTATVDLADGSKSVRKMAVNYEAITAANLHPRCECNYLLTIQGL